MSPVLAPDGASVLSPHPGLDLTAGGFRGWHPWLTTAAPSGAGGTIAAGSLAGAAFGSSPVALLARMFAGRLENLKSLTKFGGLQILVGWEPEVGWAATLTDNLLVTRKLGNR
jgi:hypothetical protein